MVTPTNATDIALRFTWDDSFEGLHTSWRREVLAAERAHRRRADRLNRRHAVLATLSVVLALLIAAGAYAWARVDPDVLARAGLDGDRIPLAIAVIGVLAALLVVVQTVARYAASAEAHRIAANRYGALAREMAATAAMPRSLRPQPDEVLNGVRARMDRYAEESPSVRGGVRRDAEG